MSVIGIKSMTELPIYALLFVSAFLSATLLPGSSEVVLLGLLASAKGQPFVLVAVAIVGNVAGSVVNWGLGRYFLVLKDRSWFPVKAAMLARAQAWFARYGSWSLLLSWVPVIGDPLTLVAGMMQVPFFRFLLLVATGKAVRYMAVFFIWQYWT